jgi:predicted nucleotidyltransferase component of viral defense system
MNLHKDKEQFAQILEATADYMGLTDIGIVEKDYFVTYFLQKIAEKQPNVIFKGGTSLSKCHKIISRFSEDIDLNVDTEAAKLTEGQRKRLETDIISIIDESGFSLTNADQVRSRRDFNRYVIDYPSTASNPTLKQNLVIETAVYIKSFPTQKMDAASLIYDFILANNAENEIAKYGLEPFKVKVQSLERTFIDKVFAIADYYLADHVGTHSRHIYDLYKLYPKIKFDSILVKLVEEVRKVRKPHTTCRSAQNDVDLQNLLRNILCEDFYKSDYNQITEALLFEDVPYREAATVLQKILDSGCFAK